MSAIWSFWTGSKKPISNTKFCCDHSTGAKVDDLLCIAARKWYAHFLVRENFKKEWNLSMIFPCLYPLVHIIDILVLVIKGRHLGFEADSDAGAPGRMLAPIPRQLLHRFNSQLSFLFVFSFLFKREFTRNAPIRQHLCSKPRDPARREGAPWKHRGNDNLLQSINSSNNGKPHRLIASETNDHKTTEWNFYSSIPSKKPAPMGLTKNAEFGIKFCFDFLQKSPECLEIHS